MDKEGGNYRLEATTNSGNVVKIMRAAIDGQFPNYEQLFPETYEIAATIDPEATREQAAKILRWVSNNTPGRIVISDRLEFGYEGETDVEPVSIGRVQGNPELTTIGVNPEFFAAAVEYVDSPDAKFHAIGPLRPVCLETGTRRALVMPIRLQD
jgi:DNA polymerase III subunit beta